MKPKILDIIDFERVNKLLEGFNQTTGFVTAILDLEGNVLSKSGWRQICTEYHRINPNTAQKCTISDTVLANKMSEGLKYHFYECLNGLIDVAVPIYIRGEHVANLFSGQFFFEKPDISFFKKQAREHGFEESSYIDALMQVPVVSQEKVMTAMDFLLNMTQMINEITFQNLELVELNEAREKSEIALLESKARADGVLNALASSIVLLDETGAIIDMNEVWKDFVVKNGSPDEDFYLGKNYLTICEKAVMRGRSEYAEQALKGIREIMSGKRKHFLMEFPCHSPNKKRWFVLRVTPFAGELPNRVVVAHVDITERKLAEVEKEKLQAQLIQAQKMESIGRLAGGVAHDFNNMLGVILGHSELAVEKSGANQEILSDLLEIQKAAERSANLTKQLLAFARKQIIEPKELNLNQIVNRMISMLQRLIGEDINLLWKPTENLWPVKVDPSQIDQLLANLCVNGRDAISGVGKLTIETGMKTFDSEYCAKHVGFIPGDFVMLAVSDDGCGMEKETRDNLFEPFFTTKDLGKGTGLGLATVYGIVKQNQGFINVYSEPGCGTTFKIYLPRYHDSEQTSTTPLPKKPLPVGTETILLVEDESTLLQMTRMMLERMGYSVLSAAAPAEAVNIAKAHKGKIHLLMTDVVMPGMNGRDLAEYLSALYPEIKQLFMSGYTANVIAHQGVLDEDVSFIQKPFSIKNLAEKVREVLDMEPLLSH